MHTREHKRQKSSPFIKMDPDCAVCSLPADAACGCEANGLDIAVKQAEQKVMGSIYSEIKKWARGRAQDFILEYFRLLTERRKDAHAADLDRIHSQAWYNYGMPPHPQTIADAQASLKRGIDEDWKASVHRYPEVLEYFFGLVNLSLPSDNDPAVRSPQLSSAGGFGGHNGHTPRKSRRTHDPPALTSAPYSSMLHGPPPRTPPPERYERRTPAPREREKRQSRQSLPPQHAPYAPYSGGHDRHGGHAPYMG